MQKAEQVKKSLLHSKFQNHIKTVAYETKDALTLFTAHFDYKGYEFDIMVEIKYFYSLTNGQITDYQIKNANEVNKTSAARDYSIEALNGVPEIIKEFLFDSTSTEERLNALHYFVGRHFDRELREHPVISKDLGFIFYTEQSNIFIMSMTMFSNEGYAYTVETYIKDIMSENRRILSSEPVRRIFSEDFNFAINITEQAIQQEFSVANAIIKVLEENFYKIV